MNSKHTRNSNGPVARWVIKIDSAMIAGNSEALARWVKEIAHLHEQGLEIILVSPGAIVEGARRLGWGDSAIDMPHQQAAAAVGQAKLVQAFDKNFQRVGIQAAQVLLIHEDFANRQRYKNIENTLETLLKLRVVPILNENDTVSTEEIRFGDNDMIAALVANMMDAERLVIITDRHTVPEATYTLLSSDDEDLSRLVDEADEHCQKKLLNKIKAARMFALSGGVTHIVPGEPSDVLESIRAERASGIEIVPGARRLIKREQWLAGHLVTRGTLVVDAETAKAFEASGGGISSHGLVDVLGHFHCNEMIQVRDSADRPVAQGISNYSSREMMQMIRAAASPLESELQTQRVKELIHFQNIVLELHNKGI